MAINFPTSLDTLTNPLSTDYLNSPSHAAQHANANDIIEALEAKVGIDASAVTTSHDYKLSEVTSSDKAVGKTATQTLTNKTLTLPIITGGIVGIDLPIGTVMNGKIAVTVASNNITLALKGADGNNPSASNPVYCKIGGVIRTVTAALSVTKNAGTNWMNAGGAELATKEIDYFAYLGYNATDGVVLGFSRIPFANQYSDFSTTTTNEKYCAISTITNAAATDYYNVIGRFAATLSAGAGYTWSVPTFTAINLIQRPIWETRCLSYSPVQSGFSVNQTKVSIYKFIGKFLNVISYASGTGTSNSANFTETLPFTVANNGVSILQYGIGGSGASTIQLSANIAGNSNVVTFAAGTGYSGGFSASGNKYSSFQLSYEPL